MLFGSCLYLCLSYIILIIQYVTAFIVVGIQLAIARVCVDVLVQVLSSDFLRLEVTYEIRY